MIGIILKKGYGSNVNQSVLGLVWLSEIEKGITNFRCELEIIMLMDMTIRMQLFINFMVVFIMDVYNAALQKRFGALNEKTKSVTKYLKEHDLTVVEKWECMYVSKRRISASDLCKGKLMFGNNFPLCLRDALYGGRTSPVCLGKKSHYVHFTSLYPSVQKDFKYLVGPVKCDILLPKHLYFPVLPLKINDKLLFVLCYLCAMERKE